MAIRCLCVLIRFLNYMTFDLDIWHAGWSRQKLGQVLRSRSQVHSQRRKMLLVVGATSSESFLSLLSEFISYGLYNDFEDDGQS